MGVSNGKSLSLNKAVKSTYIFKKIFYVLSEINEDLKGDCRSAIAFIDDSILITYFDSYNESIIEETEIKKRIRYNFNKTK